MSLKRYVLAAYLEEITEAASIRLAAMTDGRYRLRHSDERARHGAASGLSVVVGDAWTGVEREVSSLSGGETFQAALAFALGLADVVQRHAGGVHLDTLFVDEGFGALDADALEQAIAELDRLREGGRLVGVISHVAALRERISAGIRVTRTPTGSHAHIEVARDL
jgi:DNA repair protein SbcC/Rad50